MPRLAVTVTAALLTALVLPAGATLLTGGPASGCAPTPGAAATSASWDAEQLANATTIVAVGARLGVPPRGQVIALATAMQESSLRNLPGGDRDSVGLFQQRPSSGWGTPAQLRDPAYAASRFYTALLAVPGWQALPLTDAAQAVQHSAYPDAYADDEPAAIRLLGRFSGAGTAGVAVDAACTGQTGLDPAVAASAVPSPDADTPPSALTALRWAIGQLGTPYSYGGDCTAARSGNPARQCDCSSLTQRAYAAAHVDLPRTSQAQFRVGTPVPLDQVRPGDLVFSAGADGTPAEPGHVALVVRPGLLIEAPHTGAVVRLAPLTPARLTSLTGARRIVAMSSAGLDEPARGPQPR